MRQMRTRDAVVGVPEKSLLFRRTAKRMQGMQKSIHARIQRAQTRIQGQKNHPPHNVQLNPKFADKTPRELQNILRELKTELIARGFNCEIKLTYLQNIKI